MEKSFALTSWMVAFSSTLPWWTGALNPSSLKLCYLVKTLEQFIVDRFRKVMHLYELVLLRSSEYCAA